MNLQALTTLAANGEIRELELLSLEGGFYILRAQLDRGQLTLLNDVEEPIHLRSITHVRDLLRLMPPLPCVLVQQCVHDEMCGGREGPIESLRIPFSLAAPW